MTNFVKSMHILTALVSIIPEEGMQMLLQSFFKLPMACKCATWVAIAKHMRHQSVPAASGTSAKSLQLTTYAVAVSHSSTKCHLPRL